MALNKARTSVWMKAFIIVLIFAFVSLFMYQGIVGIFALFQNNASQQTTKTQTSSVAAINQANEAKVNALKQLATSQPASYTPAVNLANAYFDWAQQLSTPASGQSQLTTEAMAAAATAWLQARAAYDQASKLATKTFDPGVQTDRSAATFYSGDATAAVAIARDVVKKSPNFAPAYLNLGLFFDAENNSALAVVSFKKYVALDPKGSGVTYANSRIKALGGTVATTTTP